MQNDLREILRHFDVEMDSTPYGNGHINDTYLVQTKPRTILQRINTDIFKKPDEVMANIEAVTSFLREKIAKDGGDPSRETLRLIPTREGKPYFAAADGSAYRLYHFIEHTKSFERAESPSMFAAAAHAFGKFQRMLSDFPADTLYEVIPKFHDTSDRLRQFREAVERDVKGRAASVRKEIDFVLSYADRVSIVTDAIADGSVPLRVTHNDTKLNNVMLDEETHEGVCVIDLDTVMPGSLLYDFGDALRFGASTGAEDETDLSKISFDLTYFEAFTEAFLEEMGGDMTPRERELLPFSAQLLTLECGMRFLTDYLNGDTYFRIHREHHNLDRTRTQLKLVADIEAKMSAMAAIVAKYI
ncbi:MAG: aminoglycoside phosphotransferase family protein [Clostridia bacterium]|nr:aminoglycoside phosphotransferase family protein [Clostridia bacterium]